MSEEQETFISRKIAAYEVMKARKFNYTTCAVALVAFIIAYGTNGIINYLTVGLVIGFLGASIGISFKDYQNLGLKYGYIQKPENGNNPTNSK